MFTNEPILIPNFLVSFTLTFTSYYATLILLFTLLFSMRIYSVLTLNEINSLLKTTKLKALMIFVFLNLAGLPPLSIFYSKAYIFLYLLKTASPLYLLGFMVFNLASMYFYLQHSRIFFSSKVLTDLRSFSNRADLNQSQAVVITLMLGVGLFLIFFSEPFILIILSFIL